MIRALILCLYQQHDWNHMKSDFCHQIPHFCLYHMFLVVWREESGVFSMQWSTCLSSASDFFGLCPCTCTAGTHRLAVEAGQSPQGQVSWSSPPCHSQCLGLFLTWDFSLQLASRNKWMNTNAAVWKQECSMGLTYSKYTGLINSLDIFLMPLTKITLLLSVSVVLSSLSHIRQFNSA